MKWLLLGGYVKIEGMNPFEEVAPEDLPRTYGAKPDLAARAHGLRRPRFAFPDRGRVIFAVGCSSSGTRDPTPQTVAIRRRKRR